MTRWRPSPDEERWLEVVRGLGDALPPAAVTERTGGWRTAGTLARIALFVLGVVASALLFGVMGYDEKHMLLVAGIVAAVAAEWLATSKRLFASGIEEGLTTAGFLMIAIWVALEMLPRMSTGGASLQGLALIVAVGAAGLRRLNPLVTTGAALALVGWVGATGPARALDQSIGSGMTTFLTGAVVLATALAVGARAFRRPSHDRMLDWLVATLPFAATAQHGGIALFGVMPLARTGGEVRGLAIAVLLALGIALLTTGLKRRRHAPLWGFLGCVAALAVELRVAVPVATETWLVGWGLVALLAGIALDRYLRVPRHGLTSASLKQGEGPLDLLQIAGAAVLTQRATPESPPPAPDYEGGGGRFGGGGASGSY